MKKKNTQHDLPQQKANVENESGNMRRCGLGNPGEEIPSSGIRNPITRIFSFSNQEFTTENPESSVQLKALKA